MHVVHVIIHLCIQHEQRLEAALLAGMNKLELSCMLHTVIIHLCIQHEQRLEAALLAGMNKLELPCMLRT